MAKRLVISIFTLNEGYMQLFDSNGEALHAFSLTGTDPENGENELFEAALQEGTYYLILDECDELGKLTGFSLERVEITRDRCERTPLAKSGESVPNVPSKVAERFRDPITEHLASW